MTDLRFAFRQLLKNPGFTAVSVLTLALGIGATATIFSVVYHVLIRPPPFVKKAHRLTFVWEHAPESTPGVREGIDYRNYQQFKQRCDAFEQLAAFQSADRFLLKTEAGVVDADGQRVSHDLLPTLGVAPALGRNFLPAEDAPGGEEVVMISHQIWKSQFGEDSQIIGKTIRVNEGWETVVGVLPPEFRLPSWPSPSDFLKPLRMEVNMPRERSPRLYVIGRLKPSASRDQVQSQLTTIAMNLRRADWNKPDLTVSITSIQEEIVSRVKPLILLLSGAVGFVLLIACSNIAILSLARSSAREKEVAIRAALGAGRRRLLRQFLTESTTLSMIGGVFGVLLALWGCQLLVRLGRTHFRDLPGMGDISVSWAVLAFTFGVSLITGVLFGLIPAWKQSSRDGSPLLVERAGVSGPRASRFRSGLMIAEFALVLILLVGAGLMTRSVGKLLAVHPGFAAERLFFLDVNLDDQRYPDRRQKAEFYRQLLPRIRSLPGIDSAALVQYRPLLSSKAEYFVAIENQSPPANNRYPKVEYRPISDGYFETLQIPMIRGRTLTSDDLRDNSTAVVINQAMARRFWGEEDPLGKRLTVDAPTWLTVVGVVGDVRHRIDEAAKPTLYAPHPTNQRWPNWLTLTVRSHLPANSLVPSLRAEVQRADPNLPVAEVQTIEDILSRKTLQRRLLMAILQIFAIVTLVIAAVGLYGIIAHDVTQRTREIGIRVALGATTRNVLRFFLRQGVVLLVFGLTIGLGGAFALVRLLKGFLYEVDPLDGSTLAFASALLAMIAMIASYIPARHATRVDPMEALRDE
jgi:putative ABC transport system permease protein